MSFKIDAIGSNNSNEIYLLDELMKAEESGFTRIIIRKPQLIKFSELKGQIFKWVNYGRSAIQTDGLKQVWKVIDGKDHTVRKSRFGGEIEDEAGELVLEIFNGDYLPKKEYYISQNELHEVIQKHGMGLWKKGVFLIDSNGNYGRIKDIATHEVEDEILTKQRNLENPHKEFVAKDSIAIIVEYEKNTRISIDNIRFDREEKYIMDDKKEQPFENFSKKWTIIEEPDLASFEKKVHVSKETQSLDVFKDSLMIGSSIDFHTNNDMESGSTAVMGVKNQDQLKAMYNSANSKNELSKAVAYTFVRFITLKREELDLLLSQEKAKMEVLRLELNAQMAVFNRQMTKLNRLIVTLEIYMGESERLIQISEGEPASDDEPIMLRQMMLYMDEEFGDPDNGGIDFESIEKFDEWLIDSKKYEQLIPEPKGVVVLQPRRNDKDYADLKYDTSIFGAMERGRRRELNKKFYVLIRNGENLYKIFTDNISFGKRLFPLKSELQAIMDKMSIANIDMQQNNPDSYAYRTAENEFDRADNDVFYYQRNFLLLQGITMRTNVFGGLSSDFNFLDITTHGDRIKFVYDEEMLLNDGKERWCDYRNRINSQIKKGSRVILSGNYDLKDYEDRFNFYIENLQYSSIETPKRGLYTVKSRIVKNFEYKQAWISKKEYDLFFKEHELMKSKHKIMIRSSFSSHERYDFPSDYHQKYERSHGSQIENGVEQVRVYVLDTNGKRIKIDTSYEELFISYSYENDRTGKINNKTFIIRETDHQILNYDALVLNDIDYYLSNRIDRRNYLSMMPVLYELRDKLREELQHEKHFINFTKNELTQKYPSLSKTEIENHIIDSIEWWKNTKATVWKRPIAKDDSKAFEMVVQRVKKLCRSGNDSDFVEKTSYKYSLLVWESTLFRFYAFGISKREFAKQVREHCNTVATLNRVGRLNYCQQEVRSVLNCKSNLEKNMLDAAKENLGKVMYGRKTIKNV